MGKAESLPLAQPEAGHPADLERPLGREAPLAVEQLLHRLALDVLHGEEQLPAVLADVVDVADVLVMDARLGARLAVEALAQAGSRGDLAGQELERDRAIEGQVRGQVDLAHPALAEPALDHEVGEAAADQRVVFRRRRGVARPPRARTWIGRGRGQIGRRGHRVGQADRLAADELAIAVGQGDPTVARVSGSSLAPEMGARQPAGQGPRMAIPSLAPTTISRWAPTSRTVTARRSVSPESPASAPIDTHTA